MSKSSIAERRREACANTLKPSRLTVGNMWAILEELIGFEENAVIVRKVPIPVFLSVALVCAFRGASDATSVANYWNNNIPFLSKIYPELTFKEISHDSVTRIYASLDKLCAGHTLIDTKSTEPKYAPRLLSLFNIHGATVTFDALSTTAQVAQAVLDRGGYYLLAVTDNQPKLFEAVRNLIENSRKKEDRVTENSKHDCEEKRLCTVVPACGLPAELLEKWPGLREGCVVKAQTRSFRRRNDVWGLSNETRWFITCHPYEGGSIAPWLAECIRGHWGVESFHWTMDMSWRQDGMQCQHPASLNTREALAKMAGNLVRAFQVIDQQERGLKEPRSLAQIAHEVGSSLEVGLRWLRKLEFCKESAASAR